MSALREWDRTFDSYGAFYEHAYGQHLTFMRRVGSAGVTVLEACQSRGDWSDAPTPELTIAWLPTAAPVGVSMDLGAGRFRSRQHTGDAIIIAPGSGAEIVVDGAHVCRAMSVPYANLIDLLGQGSDVLPRDGCFGALHTGIQRVPELTGTLDTIRRVAADDRGHGTLYIDGLLLQVTAMLLRLRDSGEPKPVPAGGLAGWQTRRTTEYLASKLDTHVSLGELAAIAGLSTFHFARAFKSSTGLPPHAYQRKLRCDRAKDLLVSTALPVGEIAAAIGYETPQAFARMFRSETGVSPSEWRRNRRR